MRISGIMVPYHVQIVADCGRYYTCPVKEIDGEWFFRFKEKWHKVDDYTDADTRTTKF